MVPSRLRMRTVRVFASGVGARRVRRPADVLLVVVALLALVPLLLAAPGPTRFDVDLSELLRGFTGAWALLWSVGYAVLGVWALVLVVVVLCTRGRRRLLLDLAVAALLAVVAAVLVGRLGGTSSSESFGALLSTDPDQVFVAARLAVVTAVVVAASPAVTRPMRVVGRVVIVLGALAAVALGIAYPIGAAAGFLVGVVAAAVTHLLLGSPDSRPTARQIEDDLAGLGVAVTDVAPDVVQVPGTARYGATDPDGRRLLVEVYGRDAWDSQFLISLWTAMVRRGERPHLGRTRVAQVEHAALATLLAQQAGVPVPRVVTVAETVDGDAVLVTEVAGTPLVDVAAQVTEGLDLEGAWRSLADLHAVGIAHGRVDPTRVVVLDDGRVGLTDLAGSELAADEDDRTTDRARLLVATALAVGPERSVAAALEVLGRDGLTDVLPYLQPAVLDTATRKAVKAGDWDLAALRTGAAQAVGSEAPALQKLQRVTVRSAVIALAGAALGVVLVSKLLDVDYASLAAELSTANWWWLLAALLVAPTMPLATAFATLGATRKRVRYGPVVMFQYAVQFIALAVPSSAGRLALEVRFFQKVGVAAAGALSIGLIDSVAGFVVQLFFLALVGFTALPGLTAPIGGTPDPSASASDGGSLVTLIIWLVVVLVVAVGTTFAVPSARRRVLSFVPRARATIRSQLASAQEALTVLRRPSKVAQLLGGNLVAQLIGALMLSLSLQAFGVHVHLSQLLVVNVLVSLFAGIMPVPGGVGVTEAAYIACLQAVGVPSVVAVSASIAYRLISFYLPPLWGWAALAWLRRHDYA